MNEQTKRFFLACLARGNVVTYPLETPGSDAYFIVGRQAREGIIKGVMAVVPQECHDSISVDDLMSKERLSFATFQKFEDDNYSQRERNHMLIDSLQNGDAIKARIKGLDQRRTKNLLTDVYIFVDRIKDGVLYAKGIFPTGGKQISLERLLDAEILIKLP